MVTKIIVCPNCKNKSSIILKVDSGKFKIFFCRQCLTGFTYPAPKNIAKYYSKKYWVPKGWIGQLKVKIYAFFQSRRLKWVQKKLHRGKILDVGAGEGIFAKKIGARFTVVGIEPPFSKIKNKHIIKVDFLKWQTNQKFDAIVFWESLEHTRVPQKYLEKAYNLLKKGGLVFIEYPVLDCLESKIFGRFWYHLDLPRHLTHFTEKGLEIITAKTGFKKIDSKDVFALEYMLPGFLSSALNIKLNEGSPAILISFAVFLIPAFIIEWLSYLFNQSPIRVMIVKKV